MTQFNDTIDRMLAQAGGKIYLATLDREGLEQFVKQILLDIESELVSWRDAKDEFMDHDAYWDGYTQGMTDAILSVRLWGQSHEE